MDSSSDDQITRLLRLKRYEQPPTGYFENFLHEFRERRERDELVRQPHWLMWFERVRACAFRPDVRPWVSAAATAVVACVAVISLATIYKQPDTTQLAVQSAPTPSTLTNTKDQLDFATAVFTPTLDMQPAFLPSGDVWTLPVDSLRSDEFVQPKLEWESLDDQPMRDQ